MWESTPTPLPRLSEECARCLHHQKLGEHKQGPPNQRSSSEASCESCRELAYRALCDGNDAAWDLLLVHLWPYILRSLYAAQPELTPTQAESLGYRGLLNFHRYCTQRTDLATRFPTYPALLLTLQHFLRQAAEDSRT